MPKGKSAPRSTARSKGESTSSRCAAIPGKMRGLRSIGIARDELQILADLAAAQPHGLIPGPAKKPDALANLWWVRAAHDFAAAAATLPESQRPIHLSFAAQTLLPLCKRIVQEFISEQGMEGIRMDDGGMLAGIDAAKPCKALSAPLRLNALWYAALQATGQALLAAAPLGALAPVRDRTGDHFDRLAGRFRRAFAKAYWCDEHDRICPPETRDKPDHCALPDAEQLLLTILPASPLPRTKQRQVLRHIESQALGVIGIKLNHPDHGIVESPLHRAWLAQGVAITADTAPEADQAAALVRPMIVLWDFAKHSSPAVAGAPEESVTGIAAFYIDGRPAPGEKSDPLATAEVHGTIERFLGTGGIA